MTAETGHLVTLRDDLLDQLLGLLRADPVVEGVALVGSLGRGTADDWSDIDLLILMQDQEIARFADRPSGWPWAQAPFLHDARHNAPAGATQVNADYVRSGLPFWVDYCVFPASRTRWPADSRVVFQRRPIQAGDMSFAKLTSSSPRQAARPKTPDQARMTHLAFVPLAGKYVARRSMHACDMIQFLGDKPGYDDPGPRNQLDTLRAIAASLSDPAWAWLTAAVTAHLDLVEATL